jgi:hypothetical protein
MTAASARTVTPAKRPYKRVARPNVVQLIPGRTPQPIGPRA